MSQRPCSRRTILSRAQSGGAAIEPYTFIASPEGVRRWPTYSFNARARAHSLQPVLRPSGFCSKASRACPFRCIAQPVVKCTNGFRRTHRSAPHEYRTFRHRRVVLEPRLKCGNPRCGETGGAQAHSAVPIGKTAFEPAQGCGLPLAGLVWQVAVTSHAARQRPGQRDHPPSRNWRTK
jgi:hypothetical protein